MVEQVKSPRVQLRIYGVRHRVAGIGVPTRDRGLLIWSTIELFAMRGTARLSSREAHPGEHERMRGYATYMKVYFEFTAAGTLRCDGSNKDCVDRHGRNRSEAQEVLSFLITCLSACEFCWSG